MLSEEPTDRMEAWWPPFTTVLEHWKAGELEESRELLQAGLRRFPQAPHMLLAMARQLILEGAASGDAMDVDRIRVLAAEAAARGHDNAHVLVSAAMTMLDLDDHMAAARYLVRMEGLTAQLEPESEAVAVYAFGRLARRAGKIEEAEEMLRGAIDLDPTNAEYFAELARFYLEEGRLAQAQSVLQEGLRTHPDTEPLVALAVMLELGRRQGLEFGE